MVPQQVSFVERLSLSQRVPYRSFHCIVVDPWYIQKGVETVFISLLLLQDMVVEFARMDACSLLEETEKAVSTPLDIFYN